MSELLWSKTVHLFKNADEKYAGTKGPIWVGRSIVMGVVVGGDDPAVRLVIGHMDCGTDTAAEGWNAWNNRPKRGHAQSVQGVLG